ncbi:MAG: acetaldehyde dehydrogenase (acetylating) [Candidatus Binatia bacterium]
MQKKVPVAIVGSGNIGTDLLYKLKRSDILDPVLMVGIVPESEGLARARQMGLKTSADGIDGLLEHADEVKIVFDATSASAHEQAAPALQKTHLRIVDLTPAALGPYVVPPVNLRSHRDVQEVNLVTCGGQATVPMVAALSAVTAVDYAEIVSTVASRSAGPGTRQNIDEFTETTARSLMTVGGAHKGKAIIVMNPAEPPILMRNTVYALVEKVDQEAITASVTEMVRAVQRYVPGYRLKAGPLFDDHRVTVLLEVTGAGDFLPPYAGNLDIMTAAAVRVGEEIAERLQEKGEKR